jgi:hypothetical protein
MSKTPTEVSDYVRAAVEFVRRAVGMELDGSEESLAVLDHYVGQVPRDRPELVQLLAPAIGCYFGELCRHRFGGKWQLDGDPPEWMLEIEDGALVIAPVAIAAEALCRDDVEGYDAEVRVDPAWREPVLLALERTVPVTEEYYYSLTGRFETIQHTLDLIAGVRAHASENAPGTPN